MHEPIGVLLAGGRGSRLGGGKAIVELAGRPLIAYPLAALRAALGEAATVAVVAKRDTELPPLPGVVVWREPDRPRHPLVGIVHALRCANGCPVLVCPADLPFITPVALAELARADPGRSPAVVLTAADGGLQPLVGCYQPAARALLAPAAATGVAPVRQVVAALKPQLLRVDDAQLLFNVNSPDDLAIAEALLAPGSPGPGPG